MIFLHNLSGTRTHYTSMLTDATYTHHIPMYPLNVHTDTFASILVDIKGFLGWFNLYMNELVPYMCRYTRIKENICSLSLFHSRTLRLPSILCLSLALNFAFTRQFVCVCARALICSFKLIKSNENG